MPYTEVIRRSCWPSAPKRPILGGWAGDARHRLMAFHKGFVQRDHSPAPPIRRLVRRCILIASHPLQQSDDDEPDYHRPDDHGEVKPGHLRLNMLLHVKPRGDSCQRFAQNRTSPAVASCCISPAGTSFGITQPAPSCSARSSASCPATVRLFMDQLSTGSLATTSSPNASTTLMIVVRSSARRQLSSSTKSP